MLNKSIFKGVLDIYSKKYKVQKFNQETGELYLEYNDGKKEWYTLETATKYDGIDITLNGYLIKKYKNNSGYEFKVEEFEHNGYIVFIFKDNLGNKYVYGTGINVDSYSNGTHKPTFKLDKNGNIKEYSNNKGNINEKYTYDDYGNVLTYYSEGEDGHYTYIEYQRDFDKRTTKEITRIYDKNDHFEESIRIYDQYGDEIFYDDGTYKTYTEYDAERKHAIMSVYNSSTNESLWTKVFSI